MHAYLLIAMVVGIMFGIPKIAAHWFNMYGMFRRCGKAHTQSLGMLSDTHARLFRHIISHTNSYTNADM
jgi:hypothetical protein